jgi:protein gp37
MKNSKIEWTHHTFNPWWGCTKVSDACAHCYAETFAKRTGHDVWGPDKPRRFFGDKHWEAPLLWNDQAKKAGERQRVFCASMADVFEDYNGPKNLELLNARSQLWRLIEQTPNLDWLLLTKRPENILRFLPQAWDQTSRLWIGTTVENQEQANKRIPELLKVPARIRFLRWSHSSKKSILPSSAVRSPKPRMNCVVIFGNSLARITVRSQAEKVI